MKLSSFRELRVWQVGISLVEGVYQATRDFPREERWGLQIQIRRAAVSIPSNIAEGHNREHLGDYLRFLSIAQGSLAELETHIEIASRLGYLTRTARLGLLELVTALGKQLRALQHALKSLRTQNPLPRTQNPLPRTQNLEPVPRT